MIVETTRELIRTFQELFFEMYPEIFGNLSPEEQKKELAKRVVLSAGAITEISQLPVIVLNGPILREKKRLMRDPARITKIDDGKAIREVPPRWYDLRFDVSLACESNLELLELIEKFSQLNQSHITISAKNDDRGERIYTWSWNLMAGSDVLPNGSQVFQGKGEIIVYDVEIYSDVINEVPLISEVQPEVNLSE